MPYCFNVCCTVGAALYREDTIVDKRIHEFIWESQQSRKDADWTIPRSLDAVETQGCNDS